MVFELTFQCCFKVKSGAENNFLHMNSLEKVFLICTTQFSIEHPDVHVTVIHGTKLLNYLAWITGLLISGGRQLLLTSISAA